MPRDPKEETKIFLLPPFIGNDFVLEYYNIDEHKLLQDTKRYLKILKERCKGKIVGTSFFNTPIEDYNHIITSLNCINYHPKFTNNGNFPDIHSLLSEIHLHEFRSDNQRMNLIREDGSIDNTVIKNEDCSYCFVPSVYCNNPQHDNHGIHNIISDKELIFTAIYSIFQHFTNGIYGLQPNMQRAARRTYYFFIPVPQMLYNEIYDSTQVFVHFYTNDRPKHLIRFWFLPIKEDVANNSSVKPESSFFLEDSDTFFEQQKNLRRLLYIEVLPRQA